MSQTTNQLFMSKKTSLPAAIAGDSSVETTVTQHCSHNLTRLFRTSAWRGYPNDPHPTHSNCCITQVN